MSLEVRTGSSPSGCRCQCWLPRSLEVPLLGCWYRFQFWFRCRLTVILKVPVLQMLSVWCCVDTCVGIGAFFSTNTSFEYSILYDTSIRLHRFEGIKKKRLRNAHKKTIFFCKTEKETEYAFKKDPKRRTEKKSLKKK